MQTKSGCILNMNDYEMHCVDINLYISIHRKTHAIIQKDIF